MAKKRTLVRGKNANLNKKQTFRGKLQARQKPRCRQW